MIKSHCRCADGTRYTITIGSSTSEDCLGYQASYEALRMLKGAGKDIVVSFEIGDDGKPTKVRAETR